MKNNFFYLLLTLFCLGCGKQLTTESLEGLWYDEDQRKELFFSPDSIYEGGRSFWSFAMKYEIGSQSKIIASHDSFEVNMEYLFKNDTVFGRPYENDSEEIIGYENQYIKIPFRSGIEYDINQMGINIDFFEGESRRVPFMQKHGPGVPVFVGTSLQNPEEYLLVYNDKKYPLATLDKVFVDFSDWSPRSYSIHLFLDKNLSFEDYSKFRMLVYNNKGNAFLKVNFHILDEPSAKHLPEGFQIHDYFKSRLLYTENEILSSSVPPPPPLPDLDFFLENEFPVIYISCNESKQIILEGEAIPKENLYAALKEISKTAFKRPTFFISAHPKSKFENYLFIRNSLFKVQKDLVDEYCEAHYQKNYYNLDSEITKEIYSKFSFFERLVEYPE